MKLVYLFALLGIGGGKAIADGNPAPLLMVAIIAALTSWIF